MSKLCDEVDPKDCCTFDGIMCKFVETMCNDGNTCKLCSMHGCHRFPITKEEQE